MHFRSVMQLFVYHRPHSTSLGLTLVAWLILGTAFCCSGAITEQQRTKATELAERILAAGKLYAEGSYAKSAEQVAALQQELIQLLGSSDAELQRLVKPTYLRLVRAHGLLELEGAELEPLPSWQELTTAASATPAMPPQSGPSFTNDIAPWLIGSCGNCHINNRRGEFSMASFESLMAGAKGAAVLFPGSARSSRLVDVIESGDMPRGGGKVSAEQLAALKTWIDSGALFDGPNPSAALSSFVTVNTATPGTPSATPGMQIERASGDETVSFSRTIAPILLANCQGCHIGGQQASGGLRMDNFTQLTRGGDSGSMIVAGNSNESLLVKKIRGQSGDRMPAGGRPALSAEQIAAIATWIDEGATFDGPTADMNIETVINQVWANSAKHEELFERRQQRALDRWTRVLPNDSPATSKNNELFVLGNVPPEQLDKILERFQAAITQTQKLLKAPSNQPLLKGGLTVFVLKSRYDYSEFGRMTESRELPKEWLGHWHADPLDAYGVLAADSDRNDARGAAKQAEAVALQIVSGAYLGSFSQVPTWFAEGTARNLVKNSYRRDDRRLEAWQQAYPAALLKVEQAKTLLEGRLDEEAAGLVGMGLTNFMMERNNRRRFDQLLDALRSGETFESACTATFAPPEALVTSWLGK
jgi:mono/diheme cytochrome c family protein